MDPTLLHTPPQEIADRVKLVYVSDNEPGYRRARWGRGFTYYDSEGNRVKDEMVRERFAELVIPPAWEDVWICVRNDGHVQATGRDEKGRKQYIYHPRWEEARNRAKFDRMIAFGEALPALRAQVKADLRKRSMKREKVVAIAVRLMEETLIRIGNPEYAQQNGTYGLTTLQCDHVDVSGSNVTFEFVGKSHVEREITLRDRHLANLVRKCEELPGHQLFQFQDSDGIVYPIDSSHVNAYLREHMGGPFTAKDFRTWGGGVLAAAALYSIGSIAKVERKAEGKADEEESETAREKRISANIVAAVKQVAEGLGNTPAVCRQYYIHPAIFEAYRDDTLFEAMARAQESPPESDSDLDVTEQAVLDVLHRATP